MSVEFVPPQKNKYEVAEIEFIQQEIQLITKKIEHEKITLRILKERYEKQNSEYAKLEGRPSSLSKEEKVLNRKERAEKMKNHKVYDTVSKDKKSYQPSEEHIQIKKNTAKSEIELENIEKEINHQVLENKELTAKIADLRKERVRIRNQLNSLKETNKKIEENIDYLVQKNKVSVSKIQFEELAKTKEAGSDLQRQFEANRDALEGKYHEIIETNIKRERDNKKEQSKKRLMLGMIAENVKPSKGKGQTTLMDQIKMMENDDITDRTPILDVLVDKWKYITKFKKSMIDKYIQNSQSIREAFNKMMLFLGVDSINELPTIYQKTEEQMTSIEIYNSQLDNEVSKLEEKKQLLKVQIDKLKQFKTNKAEEKVNLAEQKQNNIAKYKSFNDELNAAIEKKRQFFALLQEPTIKFLNKMQNTYLNEFVPEKITIDNLTKINEGNIVEFLSCVESYCALIKDFDKSTQDKSTTVDLAASNKDLEKLHKEMENKLMNFKSENYINNSNFYVTLKNDMKTNSSFDETMKKMADAIANHINSGESGTPMKAKKTIKTNLSN